MPDQKHRSDASADTGGALVDQPHADLHADAVTGSAREEGTVGVIEGATRVRVVLAGEIDIDLERELRGAFRAVEATGKGIEVDAHHVTFIDSSGVSLLADLATRANPPVRVLRAPPSMKFLLSVTRIDEIVELLDTDPGLA
ncbi:STAS domain-containing protein [Luteimicrobium subarcticum]|uniref:Anti-anti-sigma factor n=1 Tax=Luteimicrobium subarcticum TaxID=620910 RepID=A0A2M8WS42_9MICO|nr:STAS domain-containing protein [Luteimicrobium subarcticum]PJI93767.1 anti-anti-sigma factor [Luteimicrobium subarcticum]